MMTALGRALAAVALAVRAPVMAAIVSAAFAQGGASALLSLKQVLLTQDLIDKYLAADPDVAAIYHAAPGGNLTPDDLPKLERAAIKHGFPSHDAYSDVGFSVSLAFAGIDPTTRAYVGETAVLKARIRDLKANAAIPPKEKADQLELLQSELDETPAGLPAPLPENIELIKKNYEKIKALRK